MKTLQGRHARCVAGLRPVAVHEDQRRYGGAGQEATQYVHADLRRPSAGGNQDLGDDNPEITDQNKVGDPVTARVSQPIYSQDGQTLIPEGARVMGHVTELHSGKGREAPSVGVAFDSVTLAGQNVTLPWPGRRLGRPRGRQGPLLEREGQRRAHRRRGRHDPRRRDGRRQGRAHRHGGGCGGRHAHLHGVRDKKPELPRGTSLAVQTQSTMPSLASIERSKKKSY